MTIPAMVTDLLVLVQQPPVPEDPGGRGADFGKSSPLGLLILILFIVAVAFLGRSMTKHLKRVPASFEADDKGPDRAAGGQAVTTQATTAQTTEDAGKPGKPKPSESPGGQSDLSD